MKSVNRDDVEENRKPFYRALNTWLEKARNEVEYVAGVHIDLPDNITQSILLARTKLGIASYWGNYEISPHITIHLCAFPKYAFAQCEETFKKNKFIPFSARIKGVKIEENKKRNNIFVMLEMGRSNELVDFHRYVIETINRYRKKMIRSKDAKKIGRGEYSEEEIEVLKKYGYVRVLDNFHPHVTIGELPIENTHKEIVTQLEELLSPLQGQAFIVSEFIFGLYPYNLERDDYDYNNNDSYVAVRLG